MVWQAASAAAMLTVAMRLYMLFSLELVTGDGFPRGVGPAFFFFDRRAVAPRVLDDFVKHLERRLVLAKTHEHAAVAIARFQPDELRHERAIGGEGSVAFAAAFEQARFEEPHLGGPHLRRLLLQALDRARGFSPVGGFHRRLGDAKQNGAVVRVGAREAALVEP